MLQKSIQYPIFALSIWMYSISSFASFQQPSIDAQSAGMGGIAINNPFTIFHNPSGITNCNSFTGGFLFHNQFVLNELSNKAVAITLPSKFVHTSLGYSHYGFSNYNEQTVRLGVAKRLFQNFSGGISLNYLSLYSPTIGHVGAFTGTIGVNGNFAPYFIGFYVDNASRQSIKYDIEAKIPLRMATTVGYLIDEKTLVTAEAEKESEMKTNFKIGIQHEIIAGFYARIGVHSNPSQYAFGLGYTIRKMAVNIAFMSHPLLGFSPYISATYGF